MPKTLHLFEKFGIELEYMIIRKSDGRVAPFVDRIMINQTGQPVSDCSVGRCEVSNELAAHVFELKVPEPTDNLEATEADFAEAVRLTNRFLETQGCELLPGPMHPTMDPVHESTTWPHEGREIYELYDRIFNCHGHGWFNLQSCHLNLPFADDEEFGLLHAAIILILPLLPALTAGSPFKEGAATGLLDTRLEVYRNNQKRFSTITGLMIPEPVFTQADYQERILQPMYVDISAVDTDGMLQEEWLNSRAAIARFMRNAIEIRLLDVQECPRADIAICNLIINTIRWLVEHRDSYLKKWALRSPTRLRRDQLLEVIRSGFDAPLLLPELTDAFRLPPGAKTVRQFWKHVVGHIGIEPLPERYASVITLLFEHGNLAERLLTRHQQLGGQNGSFSTLIRELATCLENNELFVPKSD